MGTDSRAQSRGLQGLGPLCNNLELSDTQAQIFFGSGQIGAQQQNAAIPPGTANRGGRPGSRMRTQAPPSAVRGMTGQRGQPGVGMVTEVQVADRPVTMQGLGGMKTGAKTGVGRQVHDKTFFMMELRKKISGLTGEIEGFRTELDEMQKEHQRHSIAERRYGELIKTVRELEGELADHNLALDKLRTHAPPEEVHQMYMLMKNRNFEFRSEVDAVFLEKKTHEEEVMRMDGLMEEMKRSAEFRLNELHPDQRAEYMSLKEEEGRCSYELNMTSEALEQKRARLATLEVRLQGDDIRAWMAQLQENKKRLVEEHSQLTRAAKDASLSIPEQRELLLQKVKTDNADIVALEAEASQVRQETERLRKQISEMDTDISTQKDAGTDQEKFGLLFEKDKEMSAFIESFDASKTEELTKISNKQGNIKLLLESISRSEEQAQNGIDTESQMKELEGELDFKNKELQNSEATNRRMEAELAKRQSELEKIDSLDAKSRTEIQTLEEKTAKYASDIETKFDFIEDLQQSGHEQISRMKQRKERLVDRAEVLKKQIGFLKLRCDGKKQQVKENDINSGLEAQEQRIQSYQQNIHHLENFIVSKCSEADFQDSLFACLNMSDQVNHILRKIMKEKS